MQQVDHGVEVVLESTLGTERLRIDREEEVPEPVRVGGLLRLHADRRERGARERAAQDMHHEGEAVALVARHVRRAAERSLASAFFSTVNNIQGLTWIRYSLAALVQHPSCRQP